jgi:hypothetical protein
VSGLRTLSGAARGQLPKCRHYEGSAFLDSADQRADKVSDELLDKGKQVSSFTLHMQHETGTHDCSEATVPVWQRGSSFNPRPVIAHGVAGLALCCRVPGKSCVESPFSACLPEGVSGYWAWE